MHESLLWRVDEVERISPREHEELRALWRSDPHASPFAAPAFLDFLIGSARRSGERAILARGVRSDGRLAALWPLRIDRRGELALLQGLQGDHGSCVAADDTCVESLAEGLGRVLARDDARSVSLKRVPPWGPTLAAARGALARSGLGHRIFEATPCPVLAVAPGPEVGARMTAEIERHRRVRSYQNRLRKEPGFAFEALEDASDLEGWAREFADHHELRWDRTATPSEFRSRARRAHLLGALRAAHADGSLVRFALRLGAQRLAQVAALRGPDRLVYHLVVTSSDAEPWRAGHVLIRAIGLWMAEREIPLLDFGEGAEDYKLRYANRDDRLWRVVAWRRSLSRAALSGWVDERVRRSPDWERRYDTWVNRRLRGELASRLRSVRAQARRAQRLPLAAGSALPRIAACFGPQREILYRAEGGAAASDPEVVRLEPSVALELMELEQGLLPAARAPYLEAVRRGARAFGVVRGERAVHVSWLERWSGVALPEWVVADGASPWSVLAAVTHRRERGAGLFQRTLAAIRGSVESGTPILIHTAAWNRAAQRAIEQAGFEAVAEIVTPRGETPSVHRLPSDC